MLILQRGVHESIMIGDEITVEVMAINATTIKLRATRTLPGLDTEAIYADLAETERQDLSDEFAVQVIAIKSELNKVRLGIHAPKYVSIHRKEVYDAIRRENDEFNR
jgi:carbon storage regulator